MPTVKVPLFSEVYTNVRGTVLSTKSERRLNGYIDEQGGLNVRSGLDSDGSNVASRVDGMYSWPDNFIVVVSGGNVFAYEGSLYSNVLTQLTGFIAVQLAQGKNVTFCNDATYCYAASGARIQYIASDGTTDYITDVNAPTQVTHVDYLDSYILANSTDNKFYWSDVLAGLSWDALSLAQAAGNPDKIIALKVFQRQIFLFGSNSTEIWENDGETPFSRVPGGFMEVGCIAPYSVIKLDDSLIWLSDKRYFVEYTGGIPKRLNSPFDTDISKMQDISDCIACRIENSGRTLYCFQFPIAGRTFIYEKKSELWEEWGYWHSASTSWLPFDITCSITDPTTQKTFIGQDRGEGIYVMLPDSRIEAGTGTDNSPVRFYTLTGWLDFGTSKRKENKELRFRAKRGDATAELAAQASGTTLGNDDIVLRIRWRDDGDTEFTGFYDVDLGAIGDTWQIVIIERTGIYRTRQYEIYSTSPVAICLSDAEEDFEVLAS